MLKEGRSTGQDYIGRVLDANLKYLSAVCSEFDGRKILARILWRVSWNLERMESRSSGTHAHRRRQARRIRALRPMAGWAQQSMRVRLYHTGRRRIPRIGYRAGANAATVDAEDFGLRKTARRRSCGKSLNCG